MSIVIPCYNEPDFTSTLNSISNCKKPEKGVEVIVVVNNSETASNEIINQNKKTISEIENFKINNSNFKIQVLEELDLPKKHAGVGLARKIGMDEAVRRNPDGIIVCLDADSLVEKNYLVEIEKHCINHPNSSGCGIHFEHPISGDLEKEIYKGIIAYELHLRYFISAQKWAGHPHAYQTIGSSMAVRSDIYEKVGGMPKKQAGEDFYFLQKVIQLGGFTEIKTTKVIPSPRVSDRVPFGTGKAVGDYLESDKISTTYNFKTFIDLKEVINQVENIYKSKFEDLPTSILEFWKSINGFDELDKIRSKSTSIDVFTKHFFNWFNAFQVMKYVHFYRDNYYPNEGLVKACNSLLKEHFNNELEYLTKFRTLDLQYDNTRSSKNS